MRQFNNYEAVKINNAEEAMKFLQYLEDNTDLRWYTGYKPTEINEETLNKVSFPRFFEASENKLYWEREKRFLLDKTKIIPLSEFIELKVTYTREQAESVFEDYNLLYNNDYDEQLTRENIAFLDHKFPKSTLEQVTEAVKDLGDFSIEQTKSGDIIISPINK